MMDAHTAARHARGMVEKGETTTPNVEMVRLMGVKTVSGSLPREVRAELMSGVKAGRIGRLKRDGAAPEVFFHPNSRYKAVDLQRKAKLAGIAALAGVMATASEVGAEVERNGGGLSDVLDALSREGGARL